jgi:hypothetical protein
MNKMTFGEIFFLVSFIRFAILIIKWLIYECQQSKEKEMWNLAIEQGDFTLIREFWAKEAEKEISEKLLSNEISKGPKGFKGHALRGSEGRIGRGYREYETSSPRLSDEYIPYIKKGGMVKSSAYKRADGCATKGKTKGRMV